MKRFLLFASFGFLSSLSLFAQFVDSVNVDARAIVGLTNGPEHALLVNSDKWGLLSNEKQNLVATVNAYAQKTLWDSVQVEVGLEPVMRNSGPYDYSDDNFGLWLNSYYASARWKKLFLTVGASRYQFENPQGTLSPGSFIISQNARPIPSVTVGFSDFVDVPFTGGFVEIKGELQHGWMEENRYVQNPWLHGKSGYLRLGGRWPVNIGMGVAHRAIWAGTDRDSGADYDDTLSDYWRIFKGETGVPGQTVTVGGGEFYGLGSNFGSLDLWADFVLGQIKGKVYHIKPWEDGQQIGFQQFGAIYTNNIDNFTGTTIDLPFSFLSRVNLEYSYTKWQYSSGNSDPPSGVSVADDPDGCIYNNCQKYNGRENYYNNYLYSDGWTYYDRSIGTPLMFLTQRLLNFANNPDFGLLYRRTTIFNNRMRSFNLGLEGDLLKERLSYRARFTMTENFGNFYSQYGLRWERLDLPYYFEDGIWLFYSQIAASYQVNDKLEVTGEIGVDAGDIFSTTSFLFSARYNLFSKRFK